MATSAIPKPATVLHHYLVAPPPDTAATRLPLTCYDVAWVHFHPIQRLLFFQFPCSRTHFLEQIVPNFKISLSDSLADYVPLAGNLIFPPNLDLPEFRFLPGDSVSLTVAESNEESDFNYLTGNHPRTADDFYAFVPDMPKPEYESESGVKKVPVFSVQITLFPDKGICIGLTNHHAIGDASSVVGFIKHWSSIANLVQKEGQTDRITNRSPPIFDRSLIKDPSGLLDKYWNTLKHIRVESTPLSFPINRVRATFILQKHEIQHLRDVVLSKNPSLTHLSSFTITTGYVWSCLAKSSSESGEEVDESELEYFGFAVDARARMDPPVPAAYFGNCLGLAVVETKHGELKGDNGFLLSVELIGDVISNKVNKKGELMKDSDQWLEKFGMLLTKRLFGVAGSPKFHLYETDFGWGKPKKHEAVAIDGEGSMSLCTSREFEGGLEIGLSLPMKKMEAFQQIFADGLKM